MGEARRIRGLRSRLMSYVAENWCFVQYFRKPICSSA